MEFLEMGEKALKKVVKLFCGKGSFDAGPLASASSTS